MQNGYDTDLIMKRTWLNLVSDFRTLLGKAYAEKPLVALLTSGIIGLRSYVWPTRSTVSPLIFKCDYQLETFFKRYQFKDDVYTPEELQEMSTQKFIDTQLRLDAGIQDGPLVSMVLSKARTICRGILGKYSLEEHQNLCCFGKRACKGHPLTKAYLDLKVEGPLTGSLEHIRWFKDYLKTDNILCQIIRGGPKRDRPKYRICSTLTLSFVPKTFKALRAICPDTLLGSFYTAGLGLLIREKLKAVGLNVRTLQKRHGRLAERSSVTLENVTADLSAASDSIIAGLLFRVLPLDWYRAVMFGKIPNIDIPGSNNPLRMNTVLTMGSGETFPLQLLLFYCLLCAIRELKGVKGIISVYGDDLIYPRTIHAEVETLFPKLLLKLNGDKTYANDSFRESCGSDFYRGCDVRPHNLESEHHRVNATELQQFLYKLRNGLRTRWDEKLIPITLSYLDNMLYLHADQVFYVPADYPDVSGIQVDTFENVINETEPKVNEAYQTVSLPFLKTQARKRHVNSQYIFYWQTLRMGSKTHDLAMENHWDAPDASSVITWFRTKKRIDVDCAVWNYEGQCFTPLKTTNELVAQTAERQGVKTVVARFSSSSIDPCDALGFFSARSSSGLTARVVRCTPVSTHPLVRVKRGRRGWRLS